MALQLFELFQFYPNVKGNKTKLMWCTEVAVINMTWKLKANRKKIKNSPFQSIKNDVILANNSKRVKTHPPSSIAFSKLRIPKNAISFFLFPLSPFQPIKQKRKWWTWKLLSYTLFFISSTGKWKQEDMGTQQKRQRG